MTGDELEELQMDVTVNSGYGGSSFDGIGANTTNEVASFSVTTMNNNTSTSTTSAANSDLSLPTFLQFLAAFASTGQVVASSDINEEGWKRGEIIQIDRILYHVIAFVTDLSRYMHLLRNR